jgi:hypothetical protein
VNVLLCEKNEPADLAREVPDRTRCADYTVIVGKSSSPVQSAEEEGISRDDDGFRVADGNGGYAQKVCLGEFVVRR